MFGVLWCVLFITICCVGLVDGWVEENRIGVGFMLFCEAAEYTSYT